MRLRRICPMQPHGERHLSYARIRIYGLYVPDEKGYCNRGTRVKACEAEATSLGHKTKSIKRCRHEAKMRSRERERKRKREEENLRGRTRREKQVDHRVRRPRPRERQTTTTTQGVLYRCLQITRTHTSKSEILESESRSISNPRKRRLAPLYMYVFIGELRLQGRKELVYTRTCCSLYNTCVVVSWLRKRARLGVRRATATSLS
uniref:Uncharacterized protein n=1 Tax=Trichogramma kaykai TaxID=54128 RepID=A0ABD2VY05_9HYME